jgi:Flp pilus assembly protein TadB
VDAGDDRSDRLAASRARDAEILADLARREGKRWRWHYLIGAAVAAFIVVSSLADLGLGLIVGAAIGVPAIAAILVIGTVVERRRP